MKNRNGTLLKKQDCVVGDSEGCGRVVVWEKDVGSIVEGGSYQLVGVAVRSFRGVNYLSVGADSEVVCVDDIGETAAINDSDLTEQGITRKVIKGEIDGVHYSEEYEACISRCAKVKGDDNVLAECGKCGMSMKRSKCKNLVTARVSVTGSDGKLHTVTMFDDVIKSIIGNSGQDVKRALLGAPAFHFNVDKGDIRPFYT